MSAAEQPTPPEHPKPGPRLDYGWLAEPPPKVRFITAVDTTGNSGP